MFKIELGTKVKSNINGFAGMVTSRSENMNDCNTYWVSPPVDKEGKLVKGIWLDEGEIEIIRR